MTDIHKVIILIFITYKAICLIVTKIFLRENVLIILIVIFIPVCTFQKYLIMGLHIIVYFLNNGIYLQKK